MTMSDPRITPTPSAADENELNLTDIFAQLFARAGWIAACSVMGAAIGLFIGQLPKNIYQAKSVVQIEQRSDRIQLPSELIGDLMAGLPGARLQDSGLATEVHIIRSRLVLEPVVKELRQQTIVHPKLLPVIGDLIQRGGVSRLETWFAHLLSPDFVQGNETLTVTLDELNAVYTGVTLQIHVKDSTTIEVEIPDAVTLTAVVGQPVTLPEGGTLTLNTLTAGAGREFVLMHEPMRDSVARLAEGLQIVERGKSGVVDFSFQGADPDDVVAVINAVVAEYISQNLRRRSVEIDQSITFIQDQLPAVSTELRAANEELATYRKEKQFNELSANTQELLTAAVEFEAQLEEIAFQKEQLLKVLTSNHPDFLALEAAEALLNKRLEEARDGLSRVPEVEQELARLVQRAERAQTLELQLLARVEQLRILRASAVGNIRVLEPSEVALLIGPDRFRPVIYGLLLGLFLSGAMLLLINTLRRGVDDAGEIERLGLPLFATIGKDKRLTEQSSASPLYGLAAEDPSSMTVEALRGLRTGLKFGMASTRSKVLMITSCAPGDGKSFISLNLAIVAANAGSKVLLIDADMRRGMLRRYFGLARNERGLSDLLSGATEEFIFHHEPSNLDFLPTGRMPPNPAELLEGEGFANAIKQFSDHYDLVIIDAPPALLVADPAIIGQQVGMAILVVRHLKTSGSEIQAAQKTLATGGVRLSGAVMNQYDERRSRYGRYGKYGSYYGGYRYRYENTADDPKA